MTTGMWIICAFGVLFIIAILRQIYKDFTDDGIDLDLDERHLKGPWHD